MIVEFGHRPDGGSGGANRVCLVNGDRRRHAVDFFNERSIATIKKLSGVGAEGFNVSALTFRIKGIEGKRTFTGPRRTGDDCPCSRFDIEINVLKIVLTSASDANEGAQILTVFRHG